MHQTAVGQLICWTHMLVKQESLRCFETSACLLFDADPLPSKSGSQEKQGSWSCFSTLVLSKITGRIAGINKQTKRAPVVTVVAGGDDCAPQWNPYPRPKLQHQLATNGSEHL